MDYECSCYTRKKSKIGGGQGANYLCNGLCNFIAVKFNEMQ